MENIDVEKIMEEIRQEIKDKGYKPSDLSFSDIAESVTSCNVNELDSLMQTINNSWQITIEEPFKGNKLKCFVKRIVRKIVRSVLWQQIQKQEAFNANVVRVLNSFYLDMKK